MPRLVLTGASGKLGGAVLQALLEYDLIPVKDIVISTASDPNDPKWESLKSKGLTVRHGTYDDQNSLEKAFAGCERLLLVSSPHIEMDFDAAPYGTGRERHHITAIHAARAAGVTHIYYTSLAFASSSKAGVTRAHSRTEDFLHMLTDTTYTIIREGIYSESWPLYFGHYQPGRDQRREIVVGGDGPVSWTSIADLGLGTALILVEPVARHSGITLTLASPQAYTLNDIAKSVATARGEPVSLRVVSRDEYETYYARERGMDPRNLKWWSSTYEALQKHECFQSESVLPKLLHEKGRELKPFPKTLHEMMDVDQTMVDGV